MIAAFHLIAYNHSLTSLHVSCSSFNADLANSLYRCIITRAKLYKNDSSGVIKGLKSLSFVKCGINDEYMVKISPALWATTTLTSLNLSYNSLSDEGLTTLSYLKGIDVRVIQLPNYRQLGID